MEHIDVISLPARNMVLYKTVMRGQGLWCGKNICSYPEPEVMDTQANAGNARCCFRLPLQCKVCCSMTCIWIGNAISHVLGGAEYMRNDDDIADKLILGSSLLQESAQCLGWC